MVTSQQHQEEALKADLLKLFKQKKLLMENYYQLTLQQTSAIKEEDIENLLLIIKQREELIVEIKEIDAGVEKFKLAETIKSEELNRVKSQIKELLPKIQQKDTDNISVLKNKKQNLADKISNHQKTKLTANSYHQKPAVGHAAFIDKKG